MTSAHLVLVFEQCQCILNVQALVYFAVSKKGETPIDGKTDANPEGLTAVTGKHAHAFAARLAAGGLSCKVLMGPCSTPCANCSQPSSTLLTTEAECVLRFIVMQLAAL